MDFFTKLPKITKGFDAIYRLTNSAHFLAIQESSSAEMLVGVGIPTYLLWSSPTTIVITPALVLCHLSSCMGGDVVPRFAGARFVTGLWEGPK